MSSMRSPIVTNKIANKLTNLVVKFQKVVNKVTDEIGKKDITKKVTDKIANKFTNLVVKFQKVVKKVTDEIGKKHITNKVTDQITNKVLPIMHTTYTLFPMNIKKYIFLRIYQ